MKYENPTRPRACLAVRQAGPSWLEAKCVSGYAHRQWRIVYLHTASFPLLSLEKRNGTMNNQ